MLTDASTRDATTASSWRWAALGLLPVRFIQGFIYWGGGSRRFIYDPEKLDPDSAHWMANKFQSAMPGAILGTGHVIDFLLNHFVLLYGALIAFSAAELICGIGLVAGVLTRLAALGSALFSIALMLMFGWQGATCIDEWTMAACNLAMGATLVMLGAGAWSLDAVLLRRFPALERRSWFRWLGGATPLPISSRAFENVAVIVFVCTAAFNVATYSYYRGSVVTPYHSGPVSPSVHHYTLSAARLSSDGSVVFGLYVDGGSPDVDAHVMIVQAVSPGGAVLEEWNTHTLANLPRGRIHNAYAYDQVLPARFGLDAAVGAKAVVTLPARHAIALMPGTMLRLADVSGQTFATPLDAEPA